MDFPTKLSRLCRLRDWSQRELAEALGDVSKSTVSNWMAGKADPRRRELVRLARLFDVPVQYLALDELEDPGGDGLGEPQRRLLWAAETVGYDVAIRRIMGVPDPPATGGRGASRASPPRPGKTSGAADAPPPRPGGRGRKEGRGRRDGA